MHYMVVSNFSACRKSPTHPGVASRFACKKIQRFWRSSGHRRTSSIAQKVVQSGPTIEHAKSIGFERLITYLREQSTISRCKTCLERLHRLSNIIHRPTTDRPETVNVRIFMASYMIAAFPSNVFEQMGPMETKLLESAKALLKIYEEILHSDQLMRQLPPALTKSLPVALFAYIRDFKAWKVPDEAKMVGRIRHALGALYDAQMQLPADEPADSQLNVDFRMQVRRLREKLLTIGGPGALAALDRERPEGVVRATNEPGTLSVHMSDRMTSEQLAHELLVDPNFQLTDRGTCCESEGASRVRESFHRSFWRSLSTDLRIRCFVRVLRVFVEVRNGMIEAAPPHVAMQAAELLDMDFIKQQVDAGLCTWDSCQALVENVVVLIKRAQTPHRDAETTSKWAELQAAMAAATDDKPDVFCREMEFLLDRVNALRIDAANARLRLLAPIVRSHGVDYEREKFQDKLNAGALTLERTAAWLRSDGVSSANDTFVSAMVGLVTSDVPMRAEVCPETLLMDATRIRRLQEEFTHVAQSAAFAWRSVSFVAVDTVTQIVAALATNRDMLNAAESIINVTPPIRIAIDQSSDTNDHVYRLMRTRLTTAIKTGALGSFHDSVKPQVMRLATKVNQLIQVNRRIHGVTYNRILLGET